MGRRMKLSLPSVRIGRPFLGDGVVLFPLYRIEPERPVRYRLSGDGLQDQSLSFFEDGQEGVLERLGVRNSSHERVLLLAGDEVGESGCFSASILVPPQSAMEVPGMCVGGKKLAVSPSAKYRKGTAGVMVYGGRYSVHLFDQAATCERLWLRTIGVLGDTWANRVCVSKREAKQVWSAVQGADWQAVSSVGDGQEWVCNERGLSGTALTFGGKFVHLEATIDLDGVAIKKRPLKKPPVERKPDLRRGGDGPQSLD